MPTQNLRMGPYLEIGSLQMQLVKMRSCWIRVGPQSNDWGPYKEGKRTQRQGHVETEAETGVMLPQAEDAKDHWQ